MSETVYECQNDRCPLGSRDTPGYFTGGITEQFVATLGLPPGTPWGEGYCPNCAAQGEPCGDFVPLPEGVDPYADLHAEIDAELAALEADAKNPETATTLDDLTVAKRGAQAVLEAKIAARGEVDA